VDAGLGALPPAGSRGGAPGLASPQSPVLRLIGSEATATPSLIGPRMIRILLLTLLLIVVCAGLGGFIYIGLYPPHPATHTVDHKLNNDQFPTK
jgi:hypothetical protein